MATLYQLELDQAHVNCGSCHVIQLADQSFFLIDGGYFTEGEDDRLYRFLVERSAGGIPVIAAWFFSHAHQDHVGNFIQFVRRYGASVRIQQLLYSFHPVDLSEVSAGWKSSDPATIKEFYRTVDEFCADIEITHPHAGDRFAFGELEVTILYTYEDLYPQPASFNDYSTVLMTRVGDHKILWLADVGRKAASVLLQDPARLKCDIVQVAHHGIDNHAELRKLYAATQAAVLLWPTPDYGMVERKGQDTNDYLLHGMNVQEHHVSGYGTAMLPLPYSTGAATKQRKALSLGRQAEHTFAAVGHSDSGAQFRYLTPEYVGPDRE